MKLQLLIAGQYPTCLETREVWQQVCLDKGLTLEIIELEQPEGQALIDRYGIKTFPVLIADDQIKAVGRPDPQSAQRIIHQLIDNS